MTGSSPRAEAQPPSELVVLAAGLLCISCAGIQYSFATYSNELRLRLGLSQSELSLLAGGKDIGAYGGILQGFFFDSFGPRRTLLVGGLLTAAGHAALYALTAEGGSASRLWPAFAALMVGSNGGGWIDCAVLWTLMHNAGAEKPLAGGVAKALLGLGASVFTHLYVAFLQPNARAYLLLCAVLPLLCTWVGLPFLEKLPRSPSPQRSPARARLLGWVGCWVGVLIAYLALLFLVAVFGAPQSRATERTFTSILIALFILPPAATCAHALLSPAGAEDVAPALPVDAVKPEPEAPNSPLALRGRGTGAAEIALLFTALAAGGGATLTLVNNLSQVSAALGCADAAPLVSLFAINSASGRLLMGVVSTQLAVPRPALLGCGLVLLGTTLLGLSAASCAGLSLAIVLAGNCFGSFWVLMPVIVAELWGEKSAGSLYGLLGSSPAVGSLLLGRVAGRVYDAHVVDSSTRLCRGTACFRLTFQIAAATCMLGALSALALLRRTRHWSMRAR